jgi:hypothetical protein
MWKIGTVASMTEGWASTSPTRGAGRSLRSRMRHTAKPQSPRGMLRRLSKKPSRSIRCRGDETQTPRPADDLGDMRELDVQRLVASCLNDACRHVGLIDVSNYPAETEVPSFSSKVVCAKCGSRGRHIDVRPNWKEQPPQPSLNGKQEKAPLHQPTLVMPLMPRWSVDIIRSRAEHLGTVGGRYEKEAIRQAATKFDIPPERQNRIAVTKLSGKGD